MQLNKELLHSISIWIRLPNLPLDFWTEEGISRITSVLGSPIKLEKFTEGIIKIAFARVLIEIDKSFKNPNKIPTLNEKDEIIWQEVYEWKPSPCSNCSSFGHAENQCQFNKVWIPKVNNNIVNDNSEMSIDSNGSPPDNCDISEKPNNQFSSAAFNNNKDQHLFFGSDQNKNYNHKTNDEIPESNQNTSQNIQTVQSNISSSTLSTIEDHNMIDSLKNSHDTNYADTLNINQNSKSVECSPKEVSTSISDAPSSSQRADPSN